MHLRSVLLIICLGLLTYGNALFNDFVGDDNVLIVNNSFYSSWQNFPRLFKQGYNFDTKTLITDHKDLGPGSVSYRPVDNASYFLDHHMWGLNPFGYHLTNILIHLGNMVLVYFLLVEFQLPLGLSLFAALLFGLHPVQAEAVCAIGYRADSLACFFLLIAFWTWLRFIKGGMLNGALYAASLCAYFFAVFSKESAIVLPAIILLYGIIFKTTNGKVIRSILCQSGFWVIASFYLYVYIFIFPNSALSSNHLIGDTLPSHLLGAQQIFVEYICQLLVPFYTHSIPALYAPSVSTNIIEIIAMSILMIGLVALILKQGQRSKVFLFFVLWFIVSYLPISNVVPLANPMAIRFLYLPSIGFFVALAVYLSGFSSRLVKIVQVGMIVICIVATILSNILWGNSYIVASSWLMNYPESQKAYAVLGMLYFQKKDYQTAKALFFKSVQYGGREEDNSIDYYIGICYLAEGQLERAQFHLELALKALPNFPKARLALEELMKEKAKKQ